MDISWLDGFLLSMPGASKDFKEEWQWTRYQVGGKLFAAVCKGDSGEDELVTLKLEPQEGAFLREQYEDILPGYYMNKTHWNSVRIAGEIDQFWALVRCWGCAEDTHSHSVCTCGNQWQRLPG